MRARVFSEETPAGLAWTFEVVDVSRPSGYRIMTSGMRPTWRQALAAAHAWLGHYLLPR